MNKALSLVRYAALPVFLLLSGAVLAVPVNLILSGSKLSGALEVSEPSTGTVVAAINDASYTITASSDTDAIQPATDGNGDPVPGFMLPTRFFIEIDPIDSEYPGVIGGVIVGNVDHVLYVNPSAATFRLAYREFTLNNGPTEIVAPEFATYDFSSSLVMDGIIPSTISTLVGDGPPGFWNFAGGFGESRLVIEVGEVSEPTGFVLLAAGFAALSFVRRRSVRE